MAVLKMTLVIKGEDERHAQQLARDKLASILNRWLCEQPSDAPFPEGALLLWTMRSEKGLIE